MKKHSFYRLTCILLFTWYAACLFPNDIPYYFKQINTADGLSQNSVLCIMQDRQGFMWFGTKDGVNRYDGVNFKIFSTDNTGGEIQDCVIEVLFEASDGRIWAGTNKGVSIYDPEKESFTQFKMHSQDGEIRRAIKSIKEDVKGNIWIADYYRGIYRYEPVSKTLTHIKTRDFQHLYLPTDIFESHNGTIWVGTTGQGLFYYNTELGLFERFEAIASSELNPNSLYINSIEEIGGELYLGSYYDGLLRLNTETKLLLKVQAGEGRKYPTHILAMKRMNVGELWIGTESGLYIYNEKQGEFTNIKHSHIDKYSLADNSVHSLYKDKDNGIWVGTYFSGISYLPYQHDLFHKYYPLDNGKTISGKAVRDIREDMDGNIWIGTEDAGLNKLNPKTGKFEYWGLSKADDKYRSIRALEIDNDRLWIGAFTKGLGVMNLKTGKIKHYGTDKVPSEIYSILKDRAGNIWFGEHNGAYIYEKETDSFRKVDKIGNFFMYDIKEDFEGNIWFAAISNGVICYNPYSGKVTRYINNPEDDSSVITKVIGIFEDSKNRLWFTSEGWGFCRFNRDTGTFKRYTLADGLPNSVIYYMTEDTNGLLWFGTNKGLVCFDPESDSMKVFTSENGLLSDQFNYKSAITSRDGIIYMGTTSGMISFNPLACKEQAADEVAPVFTGFQIFNKEVPMGGDSPLSKSISLTNEIELSHNQNSFSLDFVLLNYNAPANNTCLYKLEGFDNDWLSIRENQKISYSNLSPGSYTLKLKTDDDALRSLDIIINPPVWSTTYAYILYVIVAVLLLIYLYKKAASRIKSKHQQTLSRMRTEKEKESYDAKIAFYTNVAHEIRTPVTLIKGPLEHILKLNNVDEKTREDLLIMQRNSDHLLALINQLLDFRKTESGQFSLSFVNQDIIPLIKELYERFLPSFRQKGFEIHISIPQESFYVDVDKSAFSRILSNLLSNAAKFAKSYIAIELVTKKAEEDYYLLVVKNDGDIIREEMFEKVFEPFFQISMDNGENLKSGTGIGLSLARSLAELHGGELFIQKDSHTYNTFMLKLPKTQSSAVLYQEAREHNEYKESNKDSARDKVDNRYNIVIVEDNMEMLSFIQKHLVENYGVYYAMNGKDAMKILDSQHIDLVISDIAMPEMDGFELLKNIKSSVKYSHIPVIFLTAKTNLQSKITGIELGADAYIEKPFSMDFLLAQISNLLSGRKMLRDSFINLPYLHSSTIALTKADEEFMDAINEVIEQNMENVDFNIEQLANAMHTSRSSLLRKVKVISGLTVNEYIRLIRLNRAAQLLEAGKHRVNEICILTGFNSSSYFAKCFQKQFGLLPKDFVNRNKDMN